MVKPNPVIVRAIQTYDKNLFVEWNNEKKWFEIWRHCKDGAHIITPVNEVCYDIHGDTRKGAPLDFRIIKYLYQADGQRKGFNRRWKWNGRVLFNERKKWESKQKYSFYHNAAKDYYNMANIGLIDLHSDESHQVAPDVVSNCRNRIHMRSAENVKEWRDELKRND